MAKSQPRRHTIVHRSTTFLDAIAEAVDTAKTKGWFVGQVTATAPVTITAYGTTYTTVPRLASYTPAVNDVVLVLASGQQTIILGKIVGG